MQNKRIISFIFSIFSATGFSGEDLVEDVLDFRFSFSFQRILGYKLCLFAKKNNICNIL